MKRDKKLIQVPFDKDGNQLHYPEYNTKEYKDNYVFDDKLEFRYFCRGRSAAYALFKSTNINDCRQYTMFLTDLEQIMHKMTNGVISGKFTFVKRGQNFGVSLIIEEQP